MDDSPTPGWDRFSTPFASIDRSGGAEALEIHDLTPCPAEPDFDAMSDWELARYNRVRLRIDWP